MGIYDRDYYRDDAEGWWANLDGKWVTVRLMAIMAATFVAQLFTRDAGNPILAWGAFSVPPILEGQVWRLVTPYVLHPFDLIRVIFDLYLLYWAGTMVEGIYGRREFGGFLAVAAGFASGVCLLIGIVNEASTGFVGASAVVSCVLVLFACHFPTQRVMLLFVLPVPVWLIAVGVVGFNLISAMAPGGGLAPVAVLAMAGFAVSYYQTQMRVTTFLSGFGRRSQPRLRVYAEPEESEVPVPASVGDSARGGPPDPPRSRGLDEQLEAKLDQVLEKVARQGKQSLTPDENAILLRASEIYKRRRS